MGIRTSSTEYIYKGLGNVVQFGGTVRYVSPMGNDLNPGTDPTKPKLTITSALAASVSGDAISLKSGTYTDVGLDLSLKGLELWCEIGSEIAPASGVALTVSGDSCRVAGELTVTAVAGEIGVLVSGNDCVFDRTKIIGGLCGLCVTGTGIACNKLAVGLQTSVSYEIQADQGRYYRCNSVGSGLTTGFKIDSGASIGVLEQCTSSGNQTSSFYIDTGSSDWTLLNCSSGGHDGRWVDIDHTNTWSQFVYDAEKSKLITLDANNTTKAYNLFKITGQVKVSLIHAHVETVLSSNHTDCHIDLWDGTTSVDLSDATGLTLSNAPAKSAIIRNSDSTVLLDYQSSATCFKSENINFREPTNEVIVGQKGDGSPTYIRFVHTSTNTPASGALHWHIRWEAIDDDGFVEVA